MFSKYAIVNCLLIKIIDFDIAYKIKEKESPIFISLSIFLLAMKLLYQHKLSLSIE